MAAQSKQRIDECIDNLYKTKAGKALDFVSPLSLIPGWSPNWKRDWVDWTLILSSKYLGAGLLQKASSTFGSTDVNRKGCPGDPCRCSNHGRARPHRLHCQCVP
jgi:hypothetical protein